MDSKPFSPMTEESIHIALVGSNLHIGRHIIPLQNRSKTFALVNALAKDDASIDREELITEVYESPREVSERLRLSQYCSLNKLISRSRNFLEQSLIGSDVPRTIEWFAYCAQKKRWSLYTIHPA